MKNLLILREQNIEGDLFTLAKEKGINIIHFPVIKTVPLSYELPNLKEFDYIIITSQSTVRYFLEKVKISKSVPILTTGEKTANKIKKLGFTNVIIPENNSAKGIYEYILNNGLNNKKILFPRAKKGRDINLDNVKTIYVYETVYKIPENKPQVDKLINEKKIDFILFSSPSTFEGFIKIYPNWKEIFDYTKFISIGGTTEEKIKQYGGKIFFKPEKPSIKDIIMQL